MKKFPLSKLICIIIAVIALGLILFGIIYSVKTRAFYSDYSVKKQAVLKAEDGAEVKLPFIGHDGDYIDFVFEEPVSVNTVVLSEAEEENNISEFEILVSENGEFRSIYKQDYVGALRYCAFNDITTDAVRVKILKTRAGSFTIADADILSVKHERDDFRVTAYAVIDRIQAPESVDPGHMEVITDVILFGAVVFDEEGNLSYNDYEVDGKTITGKQALTNAIENIKSASGENAMPNLYINVLGPDGDTVTKEQKHDNAFNNHADSLCAALKAMVEEFGVDGVYFDYEYPYEKTGWRSYSKFLVKLDSVLGEKKIGTAIGPWGGSLTGRAQKAVDYFEVMTYDMFDENGCHATFMTGVNGVNFMKDNGYKLKKTALGLPFYGRPLDRSALWTNYSDSAERLGKFGNTDTEPIEATIWENDQNVTKTIDSPRYMNGYQMVYDKTAYAYDCGMGGMMIWHYVCDMSSDSDLSLFNAIKEAIESRQN